MSIEEITREIESSIHDPSFHAELFAWFDKKQKKPAAASAIEQLISEQYDIESRHYDMTHIQESCSVRNILRARIIAFLVVDKGGEIDLSQAKKIAEALEAHPYSLGPGREHDGKRQQHFIRVLRLLCDSITLQRLLKKIGKPHANALADQIIRHTLALSDQTAVTDACARQAALSAWLCTLRQNVGSCFATAPAIIIHDEQPEHFLQDLDEILGTGRLQRTFGGVEYAVPLSPSWGIGDLQRPFVLSQQEEVGIDVWASPGLVVALEAVGLVKSTKSFEEKVEKTKELVTPELAVLAAGRDAFFCTMEEVLQRILLTANKITKEMLDEHLSRPKGMIQTGLMRQMPLPSGQQTNTTKGCAQYLTQLEQASIAFKSLTDNALLKAWEFTLASFAETKHDFCRWNLYSSLGMGSNDEEGIGGVLFEILKSKMDGFVEEKHRHQEDYEPVFAHVKHLEARIKSASSEQEARWIQNEYRARVNEMRTIVHLRDQAHNKANLFAQLFDFLLGHYARMFKDYFQEIYDADMHEVHVGPYDDSPAGFRLLYKHGRAHTAAWTMIHTPNEFVDALSSFFIATENDIIAIPELKEIEDDLREITTSLITHVKTQKFLETAFYRMAQIHRTPLVDKPLENLDKIEKKPWAYTSGASMDTLISCYYRHETSPTQQAQWMEDPKELLVFLLDTVKHLPDRTRDAFLKDPDRSMLIHSPTHAFIFKPGWSPFKEGWLNDEYTYTWVKQNWEIPCVNRVAHMRLDRQTMSALIEILTEEVPITHRHRFRRTFERIPGSMTPREFRQYVLDEIDRDSGLHWSGRAVLQPDEIDHVLYQCLPMVEVNDLSRHLKAILQYIVGDLEDVVEPLDTLLKAFPGEMISSQRLQEICLSLILLHTRDPLSATNVHQQIRQAACKEGLAMPPPITFADTNWVKDRFAFVFNPGTEQFSLWRVNEIGGDGYPMSSWDRWLDGSRKKPQWAVFSHPQEYWA